jgi:hypothetical protein
VAMTITIPFAGSTIEIHHCKRKFKLDPMWKK